MTIRPDTAHRSSAPHRHPSADASSSRYRMTAVSTVVALTAAIVALMVPTAAQAAVDHRPPTVTITRADPETTGWYRAPVHVQFSAYDASGLDNRSTVTENGAQTGSFTMDDDDSFADVLVSHDGTTTFSYDIYDVNDNHTTGTVIIKLDATAPVINVGAPREGQTLIQGQAVRPEVVFYGDATSGQGSWGITEGTTSNGYLDTTTPGAKTLRAVSSDIAGNTTTVVRHFNVTAHQAPTMTLTPDVAPNAAGWFSTAPAVRMHVNVFDGASPKWFSYLLDDDASQSDTVNGKSDGYVLIAKQGSTSVEAQAVDSLDSIGVASRAVFKVDTVAPAATLQAAPPADLRDIVNPVHACTDLTSGVASCVLTGDVNPDGTLNTSSPGDKTVTLTAIDLAGNNTVTSRVYAVADEPGSHDPGAPVTDPGAPDTTPGPTPTNGPVTSAPRRYTLQVKQSARRQTLAVVITAAEPPAPEGGLITVTEGTTVVARATVLAGRVTIRLRGLRPGIHRLTLSYASTGSGTPATATVRVRVRGHRSHRG